MPEPTHVRANRARTPAHRASLDAHRGVGSAALVLALTLAGCAAGADPGPPVTRDTATSTPTSSVGSDGALLDAPVSTAPGEETPSTTGALAPGFPADLIPVPDGAEVLLSAVTLVGEDYVHVSLNVRSGRTTEQILSDVGGPLRDAGFSATAPTSDPGAGSDGPVVTTTLFERDGAAESVTVAVLDRDDSRTVSVSATLRSSVLPEGPRDTVDR